MKQTKAIKEALLKRKAFFIKDLWATHGHDDLVFTDAETAARHGDARPLLEAIAHQRMAAVRTAKMGVVESVERMSIAGQRLSFEDWVGRTRQRSSGTIATAASTSLLRKLYDQRLTPTEACTWLVQLAQTPTHENPKPRKGPRHARQLDRA